MFTDASIKRLQPRDIPYREFERGEIPGFHLQITPSGTKTFYLQHTQDGRRRFYRLGQYPLLSLSAARAIAREHLAILERGGDPQIKELPAATGSMAELLNAWLDEQRARGRRRIDEVERSINHDCAGILDRPAASITADDIRGILARVHQRGSRVMANRLRAHLHGLFNFGLKHDHDPRFLHRPMRFGVVVNPVVAVPRDSDAERAGERTLDWGEVRELWDTDRLTVPARQACRLLLVSGARVNEVVQAGWDEFDLDAKLWTLPEARSKNHRTLLTPLTPLAIELLAELRDMFPGSAWLFPARNVHWAAQPWGDTALGHAVRKGGYSWVPRDLRRTFKSLCGECGVSKEIRDRIQGHAQSDVSGKHYDKYSYLPEKKAALLQWERELRARLAGDNVRVLRAG